MGRPRNRPFQWVLTSLCIGFASVTRRLPLRAARLLGSLLAWPAYWLVPRARRVGLANLDLAYGDTLSPGEKRRILRASLRSVGVVAAEVSRVPLLRGGFLRSQVDVEGIEHVDPSSGALFIGAHLGNWEWLAPAMAALGVPTAAVVRPLNDPRLDRYISEMRGATGVRLIAKQGAGVEILRLLRDGWRVGVLIDQCPHDTGVPAEFFGAPCWATVAPAVLAARARCPVHLASMPRRPDGRYTLRLSPPIALSRSGNFQEDLLENTRRCQALIEEQVRAYPEQWLWLHRRWKEKPRLEEQWRKRAER